MPHFPKPFFKKSRGVWYIEVGRKQVDLGPDRKEAFRRYHALMAQPSLRAMTDSASSRSRNDSTGGRCPTG
jgi:integrase/recombinase XerD